MKKSTACGLAAGLMVILTICMTVPVYADLAYDPIEKVVYGIGPILLVLIIGSAAAALTAGIVLLIVFSVRRKKRRAAQEKKDETVSQ